MKSRSIKDERKEIALFRSRAFAAGVFVFILLLLIVSRAFYLQVVQYEHYTKLSKENYQKHIPIPPVRGKIYDRNGETLADNHKEYALEVVRDKTENLEEKLTKLAKIFSLSEKDLKKIRKKLRTRNRYQPIEIKKNLSRKEIAIFSANRPRYLGFDIAVRMERTYPLKNIAGHVLGYVGRIDKRDLKKIDKKKYKGSTHIGKAGLEKTYENLLHGEVGYLLVEVDVRGKHKKELGKKRPVAGQDLYLSLDIKLQTKIEKIFEETGHIGAVVALNPVNGEVLAMVSVPSYDLNMFVNGISHANYKALRENPDRPLYSRAFQGAYPPGSTIKPMVALAGLNTGMVTPSQSIRAPGYYRIKGKGRRYRCWKKSGHGYVNMNHAIYQSCDIYFYDLAYRMNIDRFSSELSKFGFGKKTGIDLPHEKTALLPTRDWKKKRYGTNWYPGDTVNVGIGQGYWTATPLQLAHAVGIVAMHGKNPKPHLLRAVKHDKRNSKQEYVPVPLNPPVVLKKASYWNEAIKGMVNVVHGPRGTARRSGAGATYRFAGKTGTAQVFGIAQGAKYNASKLSKKLHDHALFVAFAPVKNPQIALAVIAENAGGGSKHAAPIARKVLDAYFHPNEGENDTEESEG
ncbi:MAG TPA: penicillin-binding protein 2, partial [Thiothrix sp.]|nr:penicillin-binding protein 2 [Thiothrix sp.]